MMKHLFLSAGLIIGTLTSVFSQELVKNISDAHAGSLLCLEISEDGSTLLTGGTDKRANLWDLKTGKKIKILSHPAAVNGCDFQSGDQRFVTGGGDARLILFDGKTQKPVKIFKGHTGPVNSVVFSPVGDRAVSASTKGEVVVWDVIKGAPIAKLKGHSKSVNDLDFSPDGMYVASAGSDNLVHIWKAETGQVKKQIQAKAKGLTSITFSPDGTYLAAGTENGDILVWNALTGSQVANLSNHKGKVGSVLFTPDARFVISGGADNRILVWDLENRIVQEELPAHEKGITSLDFHGKSKTLVSGGNDGHFMIWDLSSLDIGKKKFAKGNGAPQIVCSGLSLSDANGNGMIEHQDGAAVKFTVTNKGKGQAFDLVAKVMFSNPVKGLSAEKEYLIGNLNRQASQEVSIPLSTTSDMATGSGNLIIQLEEASGSTIAPLKLAYQTKGGTNNYSYIMVLQHGFSSATGKAQVGAPITLQLTLKNTSRGEAQNLKVKYAFPPNVNAVDKLSEVIPSLGPDESKTVSVEFFANKGFTPSKLKVGVEIEGAAFTNLDDLDFSVTMNEELPASSGPVLAQEQSAEPTGDEPIYRGGGDPLKGLNVSKSSEMVIGKYYALIIGVDAYKGSWTPLRNAVSDAKSVEGMLRQKYKFDYFQTLYNGEATRSKIIQQFEWLVENVKPTDNLFIYYSGHGEFKQALNKGYWVPVDATTASTSQYISNSDIQTFLGGIRSKHTLLVSDACFSGDIFRGTTVSVPFEESEKYYREVHNRVSRQALTSGGIEPVMDGGRDGHSVFAYYLLKFLGENNRKYFDAGQLYEKIKIPVINNSEQTPKISPVKKTGDEGGQFIFIRK